MGAPVIRITLPATTQTVWTAFRDPTQIRQWFGWQYDSLDEEIRQVFSDGTVADEQEHTLHVGGHLFTLEAVGTQTVVTVTRVAPLATDGGMDWDRYYDEIDEGWRSFLEQLRFALAHHWGSARGDLLPQRRGRARSAAAAGRAGGAG